MRVNRNKLLSPQWRVFESTGTKFDKWNKKKMATPNRELNEPFLRFGAEECSAWLKRILHLKSHGLDALNSFASFTIENGTKHTLKKFLFVSIQCSLLQQTIKTWEWKPITNMPRCAAPRRTACMIYILNIKLWSVVILVARSERTNVWEKSSNFFHVQLSITSLSFFSALHIRFEMQFCCTK